MQKEIESVREGSKEQEKYSASPDGQSRIWMATINTVTYNEGIVEGSIDAGNSEDDLVGENVLGTEGDDLLSGGGLRGGLRFSLASLLIRNKYNVSMRSHERRIYFECQ